MTFLMILRESKLFQLMTTFQSGARMDEHVLRRLNRPAVSNATTAFPHMSMAKNAALVAPLLDLYGTSRFPTWYTYRPVTRDVLTLCAAYAGYLEVLEYQQQRGELNPDLLLWDVAAANNQLQVLHFLHRCKHPGCSQKAMAWAAARSHKEAMQTVALLAPHQAHDTDMWRTALRAGEIVTVKTLIEVGAYNLRDMEVAARHGHMDLLLLLIDKLPVRDDATSTSLLDAAAEYGHLNIVRCLHNQGFPCSTRAMDGAAGHNHLEIVVFLHENRQEGCTTQAMDLAATNNHLNVVKFLHENRKEGCTSAAIDGACRNNHKEMIEWLSANRNERGSGEAVSCAISEGNTERVKYLISHNAGDCTEEDLNNAVRQNYLEIVQFLTRQMGMPFTESLLRVAIKCGQVPMIRYVVENGRYEPGLAQYIALNDVHALSILHTHVPQGWSTELMDVAAEYGLTDAVQFLTTKRTEGCTTRAMDRAAAKGYFHTVEYLHGHRSEGCTTKAMDGAAENGHLLIVKLLHKHRTEGCTEQALELAARNGHLHVVQFLVENRDEGNVLRALEIAISCGREKVAHFLEQQLNMRE